MPAVLTDRNACDDRVPADWEEVLVNLHAFQELEQSLRKRSPTAAQRQQLLTLHDALVQQSAGLLEPHVLDDVSETELAQLFAKSVYLLMKIGACVAAEPPPLDTAGSQTLTRYEADFFASPVHQTELRDALHAISPLTNNELAAIERAVEQDAAAVADKQAIVSAIRTEFHLWEENPNINEATFRCFSALYPNTGFVAGEIRVIVTGMMIFFCIPFKGTELQSERFTTLSDQEKQPVRDFLARLSRFSQWQFAHFPVFGFLRGEDLPAELLQRLSKHSGRELPEVARQLSCLTAIIPLDQIDKYVVHDVWGHGWQASLLKFDNLYTELATYAQPFQLDDACDQREPRLLFGDCFEQVDGRVDLNHETLIRFVERTITHRLPVALTPVLAELLADVAEFKLLSYIAADPDLLPSSSLMEAFPAKLDLLVQDLHLYFRQATKGFRLWASKPSRQQQTIDALVARGATHASAKHSVDQAVAAWQELAAERFSEQPRWRRDGEYLRVNLAARVALNFLGVHRETLHAYERVGTLQLGQRPIKGFRDLLLIGASVFFVQSPERNLGRMDEWLSLKIEPLCERLCGSQGIE